MVKVLKNKYVTVWNSIENGFPEFNLRYSYKDKIINERKLSYLFNKINKKIDYIESERETLNNWYKEIIYYIKEFLTDSFNIGDDYVKIIFSKEYQRASIDFVKKALEFDSDISKEYIVQAIRNVWIMNSIQVILNKDIKLTPSIFAYSMIYPYTDNYLDSNKYSIAHKKEFNQRLKLVLEGIKVKPSNNIERKIFNLIELIEQQYPRNQYPEVHESLLYIHKAQENSLFMQGNSLDFIKNNILHITFEKGGTSVIADGYLTVGRLNKEEFDFMFGYGAFLQLIDDLQDINEDLKNKHKTLFSIAVEKGYLDNITNRLFWFIKTILDSSSIFTNLQSNAFKEFIKLSCYNLIFMSVAKNKEMYSKEYIKMVKRNLLVRISYLNNLNEKIESLFAKLDNSKLRVLLDYGNES
jgi:hypothetical protein